MAEVSRAEAPRRTERRGEPLRVELPAPIGVADTLWLVQTCATVLLVAAASALAEKNVWRFRLRTPPCSIA